MVFAKKKWGQNFLVDNNLLDKIIKTIDIDPEENVLEIGPGHGALSEKLVDVAKSLSMVEIDPDLIKILEVHEKLLGLKIINQDILKVDLDSLKIDSPVVVGNIPYNITSPIIFWLIEHLESWDRAYLMVQKEVAQRLTGKIGTKDYSRVTVMTGLFFDIKICFSISPNVFIPRPKVQSAFISIEKRSDFNKDDVDVKKFSQVVRMAFNQRRKMLRNSLSALDIDLDSCKIDFKRRPEQLSVSEFIDISKNII
ncbi:MAG: ribosomal RNA small subunit methyltransferase A [Candidatus Marinimicrobia bacterium]|jgi:16S rRNA (adenine1518-N6/adenine1519-N6)-dimethyltransferase|nr:ribosomal RNA small subunit methyltransferase A [Candidatus Neomarinimicrobiota bacterium]MBT4112192.1 ribosomal RNA small subunit methyltransferase A [Candidatus Neomarinimicrobiota bacterium]MBT4316677.1 ribosomal RNA small subunit methyltransferase A [Candidatus Neomarinimicrobiota bacterium]MBT4706284.1 ribosomal RNA small subunit methyltransferase A [Candidatus Neomarinimicrobiota bacterium]MBT4926106.1 ribosomal RNA small subunit methyltransferase A [Candidatus Neomarinimicrobiota bact